MQQALFIQNTNSLLLDEYEDPFLMDWLNRLRMGKVSWDEFLQKIQDPLALSRLVTVEGAFSLLHLAVLDNRLDVIEILKHEPFLKLRRNASGLNPLEIAQLLNRKEALQILQPNPESLTFPDLPNIENFEYLPLPIFESKEGFEKVLAYTAKAKQEDKIPAEKIWMGIYFDKELRRGGHPPISIQYIDDEIGFGVFAEKKLAPCTYIGEYTGIIREKTPKQLREKKHALRYTIWEGKKNFAIDAEHKGNFTRFINHSEKPNLCLQSIYWRGIPRMIFVALKEIKEGAQLTFDYGPLFWKKSRQKPKVIEDAF